MCCGSAVAHITDVFDSDSLFLLLFVVGCGSGNPLLLVPAPMVGVLLLATAFQRFAVLMFAAHLELIMLVLFISLFISLSVVSVESVELLKTACFASVHVGFAKV